MLPASDRYGIGFELNSPDGSNMLSYETLRAIFVHADQTPRDLQNTVQPPRAAKIMNKKPTAGLSLDE